MDAFPAFFPLAGRTVAVVGEGEGALAKVRLLQGSPARILRLSPEAGADPAAYAGAVLAFVAVADEGQARACAAAARAAGVPVNVTDRPALCDFTTPAVIDRGEVVAAIGTGGAAPILASLLRAQLEAALPQGIGALADLIGRLQGEVRAAFPDLAARRAFLRAMIAGPAAAAALAGEAAQAEVLLRQAIAYARMPPGSLRILDGGGPADLLTLRAARALAEADLLVVDAGADPAVLVLARRDAPRVESLAPGEAAARIEAGLQVVWVTGAGRAEATADRMAAAGVTTARV
jgi:precorrin-2 dehydrogenase/sirohydrochlorin ferrochelatase